MVDQSHGVVVAVAGTDDQVESNQLVRMVAQGQQNTAAPAPVLTVADDSYGTGAQIAEAATPRLNVLAHPKEGGHKKANGYRARCFQYDPGTAKVICPQNHALDFGGKACVTEQLIKSIAAM